MRPRNVLIDHDVHVGDPGRRNVHDVAGVQAHALRNAVGDDLLHVHARRGELAAGPGVSRSTLSSFAVSRNPPDWTTAWSGVIPAWRAT
jgi:hypothetical protein